MNGVYLNELAKGAKTATVVVPEDQLSLAIGRDGQNARLAAKLTSWRIDIKSLPEAASDSLHKLQNDPDYAFMTTQEAEVMPQVEFVLGKKSEGRPVTPEEYQVLSQFVDRIERGLLRQRELEQRAEDERQRVIAAQIPAAAYEMPLEDLGISLRFAGILAGAGYTTAGDLMLQMQLDPNAVLRLEGIGAKAIEEIEGALAKVEFPAVQVEEQPEAVEQVEAPAETVEAIEEVAEEEAELVEELPGEPESIPISMEIEQEVPAPAMLESVEAAEAAPSVTEVVEELPALTEPAPVVEGEEEPTSFDELFKLRADSLDVTASEEDEEDEEIDRATGKKKKKKKKRFVELEYDPEKDVVVAKKKRKRGVGDWDDEWSL